MPASATSSPAAILKTLKTFTYLSVHDHGLSVSLKLPVSGPQALRLPNAKPTYSLGKSGWVSFSFPKGDAVPVDTVKHWMMESYRAQAPKKFVKQLEEDQPWVRAGALPGARKG